MAKKDQNSSRGDEVGRDKVSGNKINQQVNVHRDYVDNSHQNITNKVEIDNIPLRPPSIPDYYSPSEIQMATKYFIATRWQEKPPSEHDELANSTLVIPSQLLIPHLIKNVFTDKLTRENDFKYFLILGDSGMGKSTFLINLFKIWNSKKRDREIRLYRIGSKKSWPEIEKINQLGKAPDTILLLDAFDEDQKAVKDYIKRLEEIVELTENFFKILITSRTQFFPSKKDIPLETEIRTDTSFQNIRHKYISPFNNDDIENYINKRFRNNLFFWKKNQTGEASSIVEKAPSLMVRPMLLAYLDDLLGKEYEYSFQIYEEMVNKWIEREAKRIHRSLRKTFMDNLYRFSIELAVYLYNDPENEESIIFRDDLEPFAQKHRIELSKMDLTNKSLLNRNSEGYYKFSHKSILEYFLITKYTQNLEFASKFDFERMSQAKVFHKEMMKYSIDKQVMQNTYLFVKANLSRIDLQEKDLQQVNFLGAVLNSANLWRAKLQEADLRKANLIYADLWGASLRKAKLQEANLQSANLWGANLWEAQLQNTNLQYANLQHSKLQKIDLRRANLYSANLSGASLREAKLQEANLQSANLWGADLWEAQLQNADLQYAKLQHSKLQKIDLRKTKLQRASLAGANLTDCTLTQSQFDYAKEQGAILKDVNIVPD